MSPKLVIGANGFLGSHVTRHLVQAGHDVRIMVRPNASTIGLDDLKVACFVGDIWDDDVLSQAMTGCGDVYYCVVDTRGWLSDPAPLYRTNVEGTRNVLDVAEAVYRQRPFRRLVYTSTYATVGRRRGRVATEDDVITDYLAPILGTPDGARFMTALLTSMTPEQLAPIHPLLQRCEVPTAIVWGTGDIFFKRNWADWLVDLIPGATGVVEIPGGRLFFPDERAGELVDALEAHWSTTPGGDP